MALVRTQRAQPVRRWAIDPFQEFDRLFDDMGSPFVTRTETFTYPMDLFETDEQLVLEMAVPGLSADQLDISIEGRQLSVRATLPEAPDDEKRRYWLQSIPRGEVSRTIRLPVAVDVDAIRANVHDGMLSLTMPKQSEAKVRRIAIGNG